MTTAVSVAAATGITYRKIDHWIRRGYLHLTDAELGDAGVPLRGSGYSRDLPAQEVDVAVLMDRLIAAGIRPETAARIAREAITERRQQVQLGSGLSLYIRQ